MAIWTNYTSKSTPADNDTLLEYDATGRALKQTPFSGVYNWLQAKIHALTASTGAWAASTDKLLTDRNGTLSRIDYSVLAKAIVEEYAGSSVAGANQAIKTALDSLNSNTLPYTTMILLLDRDLNTWLLSGKYIQVGTNNCTPENHYPVSKIGILEVMSYPTDTERIIQRYTTFDGEVYIRKREYNKVWGDWVAQPTRAEMDTTYRLMSVTALTANANLNSMVALGEYSAETYDVARSITNIPTGVTDPFRLRVERMLKDNVNYIRQTIKIYNSNDAYERYTNNNGTVWSAWQKQPTRAEMDAVTSAVTPVAITSNTDLNTLTTARAYYATTGAIAQSLINCPTTDNFTMLVMKKGIYCTQIIFKGVNIFTRSNGSSGFGSWYKYEGTAVS